MISRDDVFSGYRLILGREPENEGVVDYHCLSEDVLTFRKVLIESEEFSELYAMMAKQSLDIPFYEWGSHDAVRVVFMHGPKTGGTTLHNLLIQLFPKELIFSERFNGIKNHVVGTLARFSYFSGHFDLISCQLIPGEKKIVTFLREPVSRLISLYNFLKAHRHDVVARNNWGLARLASSLSVEDFFRSPVVRSHPYIENGMTRALVDFFPIEIWPVIDEKACRPSLSGAGEEALERLSSLTAFGVLEHYEASVNLIFDSLSFPRPASIDRKMVLSDLMADAGNYRKVEVAKENPRLRSIIKDLVSADLVLYEGAMDLFRQRVSLS
ncbi:hypothetical protein HNP49_003058 [Pseudomonas fluvialis]|uniref:Sulfotransferase family protein n=1 Tax=Pseudomonas fluvialis TaxID=1793966 RepID=A0A7X0BW13_9PSED|nr:sulfotransferase family 2 domain-containing protein [Pseudomonas fluvialis]MBB6342870.1 hypothetical protein [Pseudomonas fluvialis]